MSKQSFVLSPALVKRLANHTGPFSVDHLVETIVTDWVNAQEDPTQSELLLAKIAAFDARLTLLEGKSAYRPDKRKIKADSKPIADGGRWLITVDAWKLACKRGCTQTKPAFCKLAAAHPERLIAWDLKFLGANPTGNSRLASFQDLKWID
jgi:hypothetical protein